MTEALETAAKAKAKTKTNWHFILKLRSFSVEEEAKWNDYWSKKSAALSTHSNFCKLRKMPRIWNLSFHEYKLFYTDPKYELVLCKKNSDSQSQ